MSPTQGEEEEEEERSGGVFREQLSVSLGLIDGLKSDPDLWFNFSLSPVLSPSLVFFFFFFSQPSSLLVSV